MNTIIITKILLEISVKIWKMLENIVDILCVNFKPNRKVAPFQINTYLDDEEQQQQVWSKTNSSLGGQSRNGWTPLMRN